MTNIKKIIVLFFSVILVVGVLLALTTKFNLPGGYRVYNVITGSMQPELPVDSLILIRMPRTSSEIKQGDIVTFEEPTQRNRIITHRVAEVVEKDGYRYFKTKGDANQEVDPWDLAYGSVKGVYIKHLPAIGSLIKIIRSPIGILSLIVLPTLILAWLEIKNIFNLLVEGKLKKIADSKTGSSAKALLVIGLASWLSFPSSLAAFTSNQVNLSGVSLKTANVLPRTIRLAPEADSYLEERKMLDNNGAAKRAEVTSKEDKNQRAVIRFDLSQLPAGSQIVSCQLNVYLQTAPHDSRTHGVHRVTSHEDDWQEGEGKKDDVEDNESSWIWYSYPFTWAKSGGDFNPIPTDTVLTGDDNRRWLDWNVMPDCQTKDKKSWIIKDENEDSERRQKAKYRLKEYKDSEYDPYLEINYLEII